MMTVQPDSQQLRTFGFLVGGIFAAIGLWPMVLRGEGPRLWALAVGLVLILPALLWPGSLRPVYRLWMAIGQALGWINTRLILGAIFYGLVTPFGLAMRLWGRDPMRRRSDPRVETYRVVRSSRPGTHMLRQF